MENECLWCTYQGTKTGLLFPSALSSPCVSRSKHRLITGHSAQPDCVRLSSEHRREQHSCPKAFKVNSQGIWEMCEGGHISAPELDSDSDHERNLTQTHARVDLQG